MWNLGELLAYLLPRLGMAATSVGLAAMSFPALGLLAAVVVHSVARSLRHATWITAGAYTSAIAASVLHLQTVVTGDPSSSSLAFTLLTVCFSVIIVILAWLTQRQSKGPRVVWMLALVLFAISATHLGRFHGDDSSWLVELAGHHAAIPLAFAILYQDYRFALVDLFLKQALTLLALVVIAFGSYAAIVAVADQGSLAAGGLLTLWIGSTLLYPWLRRQIVHFVDSVLLGRQDYAVLKAAIAQELATRDTIPAVLDCVRDRLAEALSARRVEWRDASVTPVTTSVRGPVLNVTVPTTEHPTYEIDVYDLAEGRRLLSDDQALAESIGVIAGRRIDSVRLTNERYDQRLREQEMHKLAAQAELKALRAQINPHFLFNALTTVGYLITSSPERAVNTLMRITSLLRAVLKPDGELTTLGREVELVEHYLDIERARFEERLRVVIDVPRELRDIPIPSLLLQPIVENAVKHGVAPAVHGGDITLTASLVRRVEGRRLEIQVWNTGAPLQSGAHHGVGLSNVERRLAGHYSDKGRLTLSKVRGATVARIEMPFVEHGEDGEFAEPDTPRAVGRR